MVGGMLQSSYFNLYHKETFWTQLSFHSSQPLLYRKVCLFQETFPDCRHQRALREFSMGDVRFCFFLERGVQILCHFGAALA